MRETLKLSPKTLIAIRFDALRTSGGFSRIPAFMSDLHPPGWHVGLDLLAGLRPSCPSPGAPQTSRRHKITPYLSARQETLGPPIFFSVGESTCGTLRLYSKNNRAVTRRMAARVSELGQSFSYRLPMTRTRRDSHLTRGLGARDPKARHHLGGPSPGAPLTTQLYYRSATI